MERKTVMKDDSKKRKKKRTENTRKLHKVGRGKERI
jgi:hypothetical protein